MRQAGAEEFYRSYVSSGPRTAIAHGLPTLRKLQAGDLVIIDIHPVVDGYNADVFVLSAWANQRLSSGQPMTSTCKLNRQQSRKSRRVSEWTHLSKLCMG